MASTARSHQYSAFSPPYSGKDTPLPISGTSNLFDAGVSNKWSPTDTFSSPSSAGSGLTRLKSLTGEGREDEEKEASTRDGRSGKLHRRGASDSTFRKSQQHQRHASFPSETYSPPPSPAIGSSKKTSTRVKPLLRKLTTNDGGNSLDLSRSAAEQDGLGIYALEYSASDRNRSAADVSFASSAKRGAYHARSTSGASVYSNLTASSRPGAQYVHPMRQTPRPYTPPHAQSYNNSILDSEHSGEALNDDEDQQVRRMVRDSSHRAHSTKSITQANTPPLRLQTNSSFTRLAYGSQSNLASSPQTFRANAEAWNSPDVMSPVSQKSSFKIRKADPIMQAESIQAAREAFDAKEREKELKAEKEELRVNEREIRRKERESEKRQRSDAASQAKIKKTGPASEKVESLAGQEYANLGPGEVLPSTRPGTLPRRNTSSSAKGNVQSVWVGFMVWLKLRFIKLGRKIGF